ncbi:MAG: MFS transporter [Candidatus Neomarinimicrobiota bacterium]|nr:MFS transporter [Candidatus Neomarinimicrobiota bacterium]|tara:strand:- start:338 stop:1666 length:1329 start_codon:yes stop_codon:yes gene_type:complete
MNQSYDKKTVFCWSLYDFANQPFTTLVITFIYGTFFTTVLADNEITGTILWSRGISLTGIIVALLSPIMGALADRGGYRKFYLIFWTWVCIICSFLLWYPNVGQVTFALTLFIIANVGFEMGGVFCNAFLPDIAPKDKIGRVSGYGWSFGYVGGLLSLILALVFFIFPEVPLFDLDKTTHEHIRATNVMVAIWFAIFSIPTFLFVKQDSKKGVGVKQVLIESFDQLKNTFIQIRKYKEITKFLLARLIYNDGLITIFAFGGIYAAGTFGFSMQEIMIFAIVLNVSAGLGAFLMGFLDDVIGGKMTIQISNVGLIIACVIAVFSPNGNIVEFSIPVVGSIMITGKIMFWIAGVLIGIFSGPNQASSRSLMARFVPKDKVGEFFGFFAFSGKATSFLGPFLLGYLTKVFGSQRYGVAVVLVLLIIGAAILHYVDEDSGIEKGSK